MFQGFSRCLVNINEQTDKIPFFYVADILAGMRWWGTLINIISKLSPKSEHDKCYGKNN